MKRVLPALMLSMCVAVPLAHAASTPVAGKDYDVLRAQQSARAQGDKVKVTEFFWYGCPHCAQFEPVLEAWAKQEGNQITLTRVPVAMNSELTPHSRMYYALASLGDADRLMPTVFKAIGEGQMLLTPQAQADFLAQYGIDKNQYLQAYNSVRVQADVSHAATLIRNARIIGVPTIVVNGQYETGPGYTNSLNGTIPVLNYLVDRAVRK
ncbi:thiol:disulfide interchange protein DsbA/DsbL [Burkholderia ubonensis]|uniref:thiol:disulfide interchange protein DsbA/DsbL n=1 Tax=Burkholderia ubonensis TaxID=101571 RepID=UPI00075B7FFE|nr:thiol:disulfide interchange protein DsbA/DsbL [Burkholderia ubonensis]KVC71778.1 thiol:disulfide interchange protein [Burkholderia ubonensis]